jgi:hypothetical protein
MVSCDPRHPVSRIVWCDVKGNINHFGFSVGCAMSEVLLHSLPSEIRPINVSNFIADDEICNIIVEETNRYAEQKIISGITFSKIDFMERCEYK